MRPSQSTKYRIFTYVNDLNMSSTTSRRLQLRDIAEKKSCFFFFSLGIQQRDNPHSPHLRLALSMDPHCFLFTDKQ